MTTSHGAGTAAPVPGPSNFVLGPCPCRGCKKHVFYDGRKWCDLDGLSHSCVHSSKIGRRRWLTEKARSIIWAGR